jgi:hypothetical protein
VIGAPRHPARALARRWARPLWNLAGGASLALGALGVPLPLLPTTPFLLLAAACFLRGSPRLHAWMMTNRVFGSYLAEYRAGRGIPPRARLAAIALLWAGVGVSVVFMLENPWLRGALLLGAAAGTVHMTLVGRRRAAPQPAPPTVRLRPLGEADAAPFASWLRQPHVRRWWGGAEETERKLAAARDRLRRTIIEADGTPVGLLVWGHPTREELDEAGLAEVPESVIDVDVMIGEPAALGRGIGSAALRLLAAQALADPAVPYLIAAAAAGNDASLRAFVKAGFAIARTFDDPAAGPCLLLRHDRLVQ